MRAERRPPCPALLEGAARAPAAGPFQRLEGQRGSAVVDFVLVSVLILGLLLAVLQVAVYVHVRNVVTASAQEGARYAANADVPSGTGGSRAVEIVAQATSRRTAEGLACMSGESTEAGSGLTLVVVRCDGAVPSLVPALGNLLPLSVTGRSVKEAVR